MTTNNFSEAGETTVKPLSGKELCRITEKKIRKIKYQGIGAEISARP
jgi:hypothetical protein